ncbi:hypothetical protein OIM75_29350, partial [Escherichia coli]|nr:hypothetical protein [Escherichia coli]
RQAVERLPGEDPAQLNDPAYRRLRIITDNLKQEEHAIVQVEEMQAVNAVLYPNTALVGVQVDSEQFGSQQVSRNYHLRGRILQVPSNYNPQTRQYSGIWDGTFKPAYSDNP